MVGPKTSPNPASIKITTIPTARMPERYGTTITPSIMYDIRAPACLSSTLTMCFRRQKMPITAKQVYMCSMMLPKTY